MELSFKFIDIEWEKDGPCSYDNVKIRDGKLMSSIEGGAVLSPPPIKLTGTI
jgi:hypothetical protein